MMTRVRRVARASYKTLRKGFASAYWTYQIDVGATGKALTADRIAREVHRMTRTPVLVNLGGDIACAGRTYWDIGVANDHKAPVAEQVVPFAGAYKPLWLALGTIGADLMLAVLITTALRRQLGFQAGRSVHLLGYGCRATSLVHSIGIGTDARSAVWGVMAVAACIGAVGGALVQRTAPATPH